MEYLSTIDYWVIGIYVAILIGMGVYLQKRASASIEDYFIGGRSLPWWALGISGMASFLDVTGTMLIVSFLYMVGPRGLFIEFRGGAVLVLIFALLWTGKWHRRSGCITGAEWMIFRFGNGPGGKFARIVMAITGATVPIGMLGYMFVGIGSFLSQFIGYSPTTCAIGMVGVATIYTMASGFYGVVFTDIFQSGVILIAVLGISYMAITAITGYDGNLGELATSVTGTQGWTDVMPPAYMEMPKGYDQFNPLMLIAGLYLLRNVLDGFSTGGEAKYFGARNDRECGLLTFLWTWLMMFRWPMMMGFAVLGIFLVAEKFPDQVVLKEAEVLIKQYHPEYQDDGMKSQWRDKRASLTPEKDPELCAKLQTLLGEEYQYKLKLLSYDGTIDAEGILPAVMLFKVKQGFRGLLLIALIAASMSTFDSTVNGAAGLFTRDIYQGFLRPKASTRELMNATYLFVAVIVTSGCLIGYYATTINEIWGWITMGLGVGLMIPRILRLYWWRFNASGVVLGMMAGFTAACIQRFVLPWALPDYIIPFAEGMYGGAANVPGWVEYLYTNVLIAEPTDMQQFAVMGVVSLVASVIGTYLTKPTDRKVLENFYRRTRPFGIWGPVKSVLTTAQLDAAKKEHFHDLISVPFVFGWHVTLFMLPMEAIIGAWTAFGYTLAVFLSCLVGIYIFWYRHLPPAHSPNFFDETEPGADGLAVAPSEFG